MARCACAVSTSPSSQRTSRRSPVSAHTHAVFAGDRLDEFELRQQGKTYLEILAAGGGILSTVRAVRAASEESLAESLGERLAVMLEQGTTSVEVKSGYGLST